MRKHAKVVFKPLVSNDPSCKEYSPYGKSLVNYLKINRNYANAPRVISVSRGNSEYYIAITPSNNKTKKSDASIQKALQYAKTTLAIEGQFLSEEAEKIIKQNLRGEISQREFTELALKLAESEAR
ncbi:antitoxin VbhA family protein [Effusibacillus lacus]|uniref:Antitoxin VbhA domain-containing protein n=1 Tax=Effusibacillus lacus TaxID=1348429 RepID=A0A292YBZ0_9BACL|nr:antitoxin VbhA family protein [Effusibacillus lacus]TCS74783.1 hypothetical protein EDD64_11172 [Effusibacillus lacus]GAX88592.1 hypothetical protein EFBL_0204 [Effusibacillus lacus]